MLSFLYDEKNCFLYRCAFDMRAYGCGTGFAGGALFAGHVL